MDTRLGEFGVSWPDTDIRGSQYERGNGSIAHVGKKYFAVLPVGYVDDGTLETLRKEYAEPVLSEIVAEAPTGWGVTTEEPAPEEPPAQERKRR